MPVNPAVLRVVVRSLNCFSNTEILASAFSSLIASVILSIPSFAARYPFLLLFTQVEILFNNVLLEASEAPFSADSNLSTASTASRIFFFNNLYSSEFKPFILLVWIL